MKLCTYICFWSPQSDKAFRRYTWFCIVLSFFYLSKLYRIWSSRSEDPQNFTLWRDVRPTALRVASVLDPVALVCDSLLYLPQNARQIFSFLKYIRIYKLYKDMNRGRKLGLLSFPLFYLPLCSFFYHFLVIKPPAL